MFQKNKKRPKKSRVGKDGRNKTIFWPENMLGLQIRMHDWNYFFLFLNWNIYCGYSIEPSRWDDSFEYPKHMFKPMDKKY